MMGKSDGYDAASVRSAARNSRLTAAAKPGPATIPNHSPQTQAQTVLERPRAPSLPPRENAQVQGTHTPRAQAEPALLLA